MDRLHIGNGLNRTETRLLEAVRSGLNAPGRLFEAVERTEERVFMGDSSFFLCMKSLCESTPPLLETGDKTAFKLPGADKPPEEFRRQELLLSEAGERVLRGALDWVAVGGLDKWLGGVHPTKTYLWRWDPGALALEPPTDGARPC